MKLLGSNTSPYVRKVRVVMAEKKIDAHYELVDITSVDSPLRASNPLGKVPCLITDDGGAVFDSRVIVEYLDNLTPVHRLIPPTGRSRVEVRTWEALADGLSDAAILVRAEQGMVKDEQRRPSVIAWQMGKIESALAAMSAMLGDKPWCVDGKYSLADIAVGCTLGYLEFRFSQLGWRTQFSNLAAHADKLFTRQSFVDSQPA